MLRALPLLGLALAAALAVLVARTVDLQPQVDERFFFTPGSDVVREARALERQFGSQALLVVTAHAPDITGERYRQRIERLSARLTALERVESVTSLARGPKDYADARESPLWSRLLLLDGVSATALVLSVKADDAHRLIEGVARVLREEQAPDFRLSIAGVPYVVDAIGHSLASDFVTFSVAAVGVFAVLLLVLFRSLAVLLGALTACAVAALLTLLMQDVLGGRIGLLTANLVTIAFVLTQSHLVFLTHNCRQLRPQCASQAEAVRRGLRLTLVASGWCMAAALLGFGSLLAVDAQPLRELGTGGLIATVAALLSAYGVYPAFLLWQRSAPAKGRSAGARRAPAPAPRRLAVGALLAALALGIGAVRIDSDPSLLEYFSTSSPVHRSLAAIDPHGGSSPLNLAVQRRDGARLDTEESYQAMWRLQRALQRDPAVGTVLSLPVLMAEADRRPLASLLPWNWLLDLLSRPSFDRVARGFVNEDRTQAMFMLRMNEAGRTERRTEVIARLERIALAQGFRVVAAGGTYALQGRLADAVVYSLVEGLVLLLVSVAIIAWAVTRSLRATAAMLACTATVPAMSLGLFGLFDVPLDVIATPGVNVAIGVAVDSMIHLGAAWRRAGGWDAGAAAATQALREQSGAILAFSAVVVAGFSIFMASSFPPTQRFGLTVVIGALTAGAMALWVFPALLRPGEPARRRRAAVSS